MKLRVNIKQNEIWRSISWTFFNSLDNNKHTISKCNKKVKFLSFGKMELNSYIVPLYNITSHPVFLLY